MIKININEELIKDMNVFPNTMNTENDMKAINYIMKLHKNLIYALEIGTNVGITTLQMSKNFPNIHIYTVDNMSDKYIGGQLEHIENITQLYGNSQCYKHDKIFDFVFVDADHTYTGVKNDLLNILNYIRINTIVAFHDVCDDYRFQGINQFMSELDMIGLTVYKVNNTNISYIIFDDYNYYSIDGLKKYYSYGV